MLQESTKSDIEKISRELLKDTKSFDLFPTKVDEIITHTELVSDASLELENIDRSFFERIAESTSQKYKVLQSGLSKIKGFFDRSEKTIFIDSSQNFGRQNFVKLHEVGHSVLPWQSEIMLALDNNETLTSFDDQFEAEANYFASVTLFQHDRFYSELNKLPLNIGSGMALAKKFGSSVHASLRNYVIQLRNRCALLVLTPIKGAKGNKALCSKRDIFYSESFSSKIGKIMFPDEFGFKWEFMKDYQFKKKFKTNGYIELSTTCGETLSSNYHYFFNSFNVFVLIFPKGEKNKVKTKIVLS